MRNESSSNSEYSESSSVSIPGILFFLVVGASLGHCWWVGDYVSTIAIAAIGVGSVVGYWYGIWRTVGSSIGLYAGYQYAAPAAAQLMPRIEKQFGQSIPADTGVLLSGALVGIGVTLVFLIIGIVMFRYSQSLKRYVELNRFAYEPL
jgi:mannitol-specific phosphotransferase system IIBC component